MERGRGKCRGLTRGAMGLLPVHPPPNHLATETEDRENRPAGPVTQPGKPPNIFGMKRRTCIATWNVRTLYAAGKLEQADKEARRLNIDIVGISEARWTSFGEERTPTGGKFLYSGKPEGQFHEYVVGFLLSKEAS